MGIALYVASICLEITQVFFMIAATIVFLHCFYDPGFLWNKTKAILVFLYSIGCVAIEMLFKSLALPAIYSLILIVFVVMHDYQGKKFQGLLRFAFVYWIIYFCTVLIDYIAISYIFPEQDVLSVALRNYTYHAIIESALLTIFFGTCFLYLYKRVYQLGIALHFNKREKFFAIIYSLICVLLFCIVFIKGKSDRISIIMLGCTFVLTAALVPIFFYYLQITEHFQERTKVQESFMQAELTHFHQYKQSQEETAHFRHDIKNNLLCMNEMLHRGKTQEATEYLKNLLDDVSTLSAEYITGDEILDSILAFKAQKMDRWGISFTLDGVLAGGLYWRPVDICTVFANALDNAIEACENLPREQRQISMNIKATPQHWFIRIENPVAEAVDTGRLFRKKDGYTSKDNPQHHGMGTYNMKHTVESYDGVMKAEYTDHKFILEIMIHKTGV